MARFCRRMLAFGHSPSFAFLNPFLISFSRSSDWVSTSFSSPLSSSCFQPCLSSSPIIFERNSRSLNQRCSFWEFSRRWISAEVKLDESASSGEGTFPNAQGAGKDSQESCSAAEESHEQIPDVKKMVLTAALARVPKLGWTEEAILAGAKDVDMSPSIVGAFPRKEAELVEFFMDECIEKLTEESENHKEELSNMILSARIIWLVRRRLEMQKPYISKWTQALSIQSNPLNLPRTLKQRALLMDEIWHAAGDRSSDLDWYTKRAILGGVYTATELYMLTDYSPEYRETWSFLERRVKDAIDCRKTAQEATQLAMAMGAGFGNMMNSFLRKQSPSGSGI